MKFKRIAAVITAAALTLTLAGCGKEETQSRSNINKTESVSGGNTNTSSSIKQEQALPEEKPIEMTDEIKNAALNSGLVQYNNDIFQRGGYMTVDEFVEKWKDKYDITYRDGPYEERKDYLLEYCDFETCFNSFVFAGVRWDARSIDNFAAKQYPLTLKPKSGMGDNIIAYAVNATSPDEKITLDKAIIIELIPNKREYVYSTPEWFPMGLNYIYFRSKYSSANESYNVNNLGDILEAKGFIKYSDFVQGSSSLPDFKDEGAHNTYWKFTYGDMACYAVGEKNLFGARPVYFYQFVFNSDTDKIDYANCTLEYLYKE